MGTGNAWSSDSNRAQRVRIAQIVIAVSLVCALAFMLIGLPPLAGVSLLVTLVSALTMVLESALLKRHP